MNPRPPIVLRQRRDFGQTISDSFAFMRQNAKPLFKAIITICFPPVLIALLIIGYFMYGMFSGIQSAMVSGDGPPVMSGVGLTFSMLLYYPCLIFSGVMLEAVTHEYIRAYERGEHMGIATGDLWRRSIGQFWSYFGMLLLNGIATAAGLLLCLLPGLWIGTAFAFAPVAHGVERSGATESLGRSFKLVHKNWWLTFALALVMFIIMYVIIMAVFAPFYAVALVGIFTGAANGFSDGVPMVSVIVGGIGYLVAIAVSFLLVSWFRSGIALWYFSMVEEFEGKGLQERLQNLGTV